MAVITIARQFGAGGRTLGQMLARELDYQFLDDIIIQELAKRVKVSEQSVKDMEKSAGSMFSRIISSALSRDYMERLTGEDIGYIDENIYVETLREVIREIADRDNVILLGRGSQYILKDHPNAFHFLLVAGKEERIRFIQKSYKFSDEKAYQAVIAGEKRRKNLYSKFGKTDYNDPQLYHMVINTSRLDLQQAAAQILLLTR